MTDHRVTGPITSLNDPELKIARLRIDEWVQRHQEDLLEWNRELVSIPSMNRCTGGDEAAVQQVVHRRLSALGCDVDRFLPTEVPGLEHHPAYLAGRNYVDRPNVVGCKAGAGPGVGRSIMFSGHIDTVPLAGEEWSVDPFAAAVKDGRQYGLGLFDMKGGLAAALAALQALQELGIRLAGDVWIESVVDEEFGGANGTLASRMRGHHADLVIVPEPTNMAICPAHQGGAMYRIEYTGSSGRGFSGESLLNPAFAGARFLELFREYQRYHADKPSPSPWYADGSLPAYIQGMQAGCPDFPIYDRAPSSCKIDVWLQCYPGTTEDEQFADFRDFYEAHARKDELLAAWPVTITKLIRFLPGGELPEGHEVVGLLSDVAGQIVPDGLPVQGAPLACDAFMFPLFSDAPVVIWGPSGGNAHAADEYIDVAAFYELVKLYALTMIVWCGIAPEESVR